MSDDVRYAKSLVTGNWYKVTEWKEVDGHPERIIAGDKVQIDESDVPENVKRAHEIAEESAQTSQDGDKEGGDHNGD